MPYEASVFDVMIASPADVQAERDVVREAVHEWNAVHSRTRGIVLLPVGWETHSAPMTGDRPQAIINSQVLVNSDLLIAVFWTRLGSHTGEAESGTVEEIEKHVAAGKPAMIYFSNKPAPPNTLDRDQHAALEAFRSDLEKERKALYEVFDSESDLRGKVGRQLGLTVNKHPFFEVARRTDGGLESQREAEPLVPSLTPEAEELLMAALAGGGRIMSVRFMGGGAVKADRRNFVQPNDPRSLATWEGALDELIGANLVRDVGNKGEVFQVTRGGYKLGDSLRR